ncbi:MAG: hypothetical protein IKL62_03175 [Clostridia bacterium]|nr:hypothetical protein [Clostridia bacterium]
MKKLLALILALVMCFALVACGSDDEEKTDDDDNDIVDIGGNNNNAVAEWVEENEDDMLAAMEQSFAGSSGMTCTSSIKVSGNGFTINININELTNVTADQKKQLQDTYDSMDSQFETLLDNAQLELPELEYINYNVCDKYGNVLAVIRTGD